MKCHLLVFSSILLVASGADTCGFQNLQEDINGVVLRAIGRMPHGGRYATTAIANQQLSAAIRCAGSGLSVHPETAVPSYCSGATYLVFLAALEELSSSGQIVISRAALDALPVAGNRDGEGVWGRWNANGPGTARLFAEAGLGRNFTDWGKARPGDFLKLWWNEEIGSKERGHSVIFLGQEQIDGVAHIRFWSSNSPDGYGEKIVPRSKIARVLFSRLDRPARINRVAVLPPLDDFLATMLNRSATQEEINRVCKVEQ